MVILEYGQPTEIQKFLNGHASLISGSNALSEKFGITTTTELIELSDDDSVSEPIFIYNCDNSKGSRYPIEDEANKLILSNQRKIISKTFPKIHDIKEIRYANQIDVDSAEVEECLDGTHVSIFKHDKMFFIRAWHNDSDVATSIENEVKNILSSKCAPWFTPFGENDIGKSCCWTFEFVSPKFKNIVEYDKPDLYLLAMFNKEHSFECSKQFTDNFAIQNGFSRLERKKIKTLGHVSSVLSKMTTLDKGFIISDNNKHRVKAINPIYKIINNMKDAKHKPSVDDLAKLVLLGYHDEIALHCSEYSEVIKLIKQSIESLLSEASMLWDLAIQAKSRKEFADKISPRRPISRLLFEHYARKTTPYKDVDYTKYIKPKHIIEKAKIANLQKFYAAVCNAEIDRESKAKKMS